MIKNSDRRRDDSIQPVSRLFRSWIAEPLVRWHRRNVLYREMMSLNDRTLADIGMSRFDVPYFVQHTDIDGGPVKSRVLNEDTSVRLNVSVSRLPA